MNRRVPILAAALAAVTVFSSCSTFDDTAASVAGLHISRQSFESDLKAWESEGSQQVLAGLKLTALDGPAIDGDVARFWLGYLIRLKIGETLLADRGGVLTDADTAGLDEKLNADPSVSQLADSLKSSVKQELAVAKAVQRMITAAPSPADLEASYSADPARTGALCLRHILVKTLAEAQDIEALLADGGDFATLAGQHSLDTASGQAGGALGSDTQPCTLLATLTGQFDPAFLAGALHAKPGVPTAPVKSSFGWHIILARPFSEVSDGLSALVATDPATAAIFAAYATTTVSVASRYGVWDAVTAKVTAGS